MTGQVDRSQAVQPVCVCVCARALMLIADNHQQYFFVLLADGSCNDVYILDVWHARTTFSSHEKWVKS